MIKLSVCELISHAVFAMKNFQLVEKSSRANCRSAADRAGASHGLYQPKSQIALIAFTSNPAPAEPRTNNGNPPRNQITVRIPIKFATLLAMSHKFAVAFS